MGMWGTILGLAGICAVFIALLVGLSIVGL
jgi:hypothetical protein